MTRTLVLIILLPLSVFAQPHNRFVVDTVAIWQDTSFFHCGQDSTIDSLSCFGCIEGVIGAGQNSNSTPYASDSLNPVGYQTLLGKPGAYMWRTSIVGNYISRHTSNTTVPWADVPSVRIDSVFLRLVTTGGTGNDEQPYYLYIILNRVWRYNSPFVGNPVIKTAYDNIMYLPLSPAPNYAAFPWVTWPLAWPGLITGLPSDSMLYSSTPTDTTTDRLRVTSTPAMLALVDSLAHVTDSLLAWNVGVACYANQYSDSSLLQDNTVISYVNLFGNEISNPNLKPQYEVYWTHMGNYVSLLKRKRDKR